MCIRDSSRMLALPGEPPAAGSVTATARFTRHEEEGLSLIHI